MSEPGRMAAPINVEYASIAARVVRCGCGNPNTHIPGPCPKPRTTEDLGIVSEYRRPGPLMRWATRLKGNK